MNKKIYMDGLIQLLEENINFEQYDKLLDSSNLFVVPSTCIKKNLNSNYYSLLNFINLEKIDNVYIEKLNSKVSVDEEVINIVKSTYKEVLKKGDSEYIMYAPPIPDHRVPNGSIVLELVIGKSNCNYDVDRYLELIKKQREYIEKINNDIKKIIEEKMGIPCVIFFDKRM